MSFDAIRYAMTVPGLTSSERLLFIYIADAETDGQTFAGQQWFAKKTGMSIRTVRSALVGLEDKGHIERKKRFVDKQERQRTTDMITARIPEKRRKKTAKLPAKFAAPLRQNVPSNPYSPYGVVEGKGKGGYQDGATGEVIAFPNGGARGQHNAPAGKQSSSLSDLHDIQSYLEVPLS